MVGREVEGLRFKAEGYKLQVSSGRKDVKTRSYAKGRKVELVRCKVSGRRSQVWPQRREEEHVF
jgi:hypothetical protein